MHLHVCCSVPRAIHMEFFHDHARIERMFFDGFCEPVKGIMSPDLSRPGMGLELKEQDAAGIWSIEKSICSAESGIEWQSKYQI